MQNPVIIFVEIIVAFGLLLAQINGENIVDTKKDFWIILLSYGALYMTFMEICTHLIDFYNSLK